MYIEKDWDVVCRWRRGDCHRNGWALRDFSAKALLNQISRQQLVFFTVRNVSLKRLSLNSGSSPRLHSPLEVLMVLQS